MAAVFIICSLGKITYAVRAMKTTELITDGLLFLENRWFILAAAAAVCAMGLAGEIGWSGMHDGDGNATYRNRIIDAIYNMDGQILDKGARYEIR